MTMMMMPISVSRDIVPENKLTFLLLFRVKSGSFDAPSFQQIFRILSIPYICNATVRAHQFFWSLYYSPFSSPISISMKANSNSDVGPIYQFWGWYMHCGPYTADKFWGQSPLTRSSAPRRRPPPRLAHIWCGYSIKTSGHVVNQDISVAERAIN